MYEAKAWQSYRQDDEGWALMANFVARITAETRKHDGMNTSSVLTIEGEMPPDDPDDKERKPVKLPAIEIGSEEFAAMNWVLRYWGVRCIVYPIPGVKDDLRTMIQTQSKPVLTNVYQHTGWAKIGKRNVYLHRGGGIGPAGNDPSITVELPPELDRFDLTCDAEPKHSVNATLALLDLGPPDLMYPLLAATLAPLYGPLDFGFHLAGRTGSFKSELASLSQSHYGPGLDARHLPGSWASTANANECLAYLAKDAVFVVDDYVPGGTNWQQKALAAQADKLFRAQGNQSGRARLTDVSKMQRTMYPRGLVLSTGEDTPEGHSCRSRIMIREISPGTIDPADLTRCQKARPLYCGTVAWLARSLAQAPADLTERVEQIRNEERGSSHGRTATTVARLVAVFEDFIERARAAGFVGTPVARDIAALANKAIRTAGADQRQFLEAADPIDAFCAGIRSVLATGGGHLRQLNGGTPGHSAELGWTVERSFRDEMPLYKSRGPCIGWVVIRNDELYLDMTAGFAIVLKACGGNVPLTPQTLLKRLKEAGLMLRAEESRSRNTVRIVAENARRQTLCLSLRKVMQWEDKGDGSDPEPDEPAGRGARDAADDQDED